MSPNLHFNLQIKMPKRESRSEMGLLNTLSRLPPPPTPYIVNGWVARNHQFPFMAAILNGNRQFCGGSLIDNIHILTAAHCVAQ